MKLCIKSLGAFNIYAIHLLIKSPHKIPNHLNNVCNSMNQDNKIISV